MEDNNTPIYRVALANGKSKDYTEKEYRDLDIAGWLDQNHHGQYNVFKLSNAPADSVTKDQQYVVSITQNGQTKSKLYSGQEFMDLDMNGWLEANHSGNYQIQSVRGYSDASLAVNEDTWKKQAEQQKAALDKFDEDNKSFMRQHEADTLVYDAGEGVMVDNDKYRQDELKYQELANQRQALQSEYSNNPYIRSQYKAEAEYADQKAAEYEAEKNKRSKDDDDYRYFSQARKLEMDAAKTWAVDVAQAPGENGFADYMSNYGKGAGKVFSDRDFWTRGISAISRDLNVRKIFKKLQDKGFNLNTITEKELDENLTPGEKALIFSFIRLADAQAARAKDMAPGYTAGQTAADSVGFMAEFFISGGIGKVAGSALKEGVQQGLRAFIGRALTTGSAEAIRSATSRGMINAFTKGGQRALTQGMKQAVKAGTAAATGVYKYGVRPVEEAAWHTALQLSTYRTIADDLTQIDNNGKLVEAGTAIWGGVLDSFIENWSESMGDFVNDVIGLPFKGAAGLGKKLLGETSLTQWGRWLADTTAAKVLTQAGFHGLIGEMGEEWVGNAARVGLGLMSGDEFKDFRDLHNQLDMAASFAPMSLFGLGSSSYAAAREAKNYRQTVESFRGVLNRTEGMTQEEIANIFDTKHTKTEIADILTPVLQKIVHGRETNSTAFEDYITTLKMAQALSMHEVVSTAQSVEKNLARDEMRRQIETELGSTTDADGRGKFTHRMATERLDENGNPYEVEAVTTVKDAEGNEWFYMGDNGSQVVLKKRGEAGGKPMFLTQTEYEQRVESGEFTQKTQLASQFLDEQVQQKRTAERQARANQEIQDRYSALLKRFHNDPNINLGTEDAPLNGTVMSVGYDGVIVDFGQPVLLNGETLAIHKLSLEQAGNAVGLDTSMRSEEQRDADAVDRDEKARKRVASYNRTFSGKDFTINGDPYTYVKMFEAPFLDENGNEMVRVVATDAQGVDVEVALPLADLESQALTQQEREQSDANIERTDEETSADNSGSPKDFRGNDIPMRVNEKTGEEEVDKREFKKRDPEAYYKWNDSRRGGNTADSMEAIQADIAAKSKERETLAKQKSAETDPDMRDELEGQITRLDNEINLLSRIYHKYDAANNFQEVEKRYKEQFQEIRQRLLHAKSQEQIDELQQKQRVLYLRYIMETEGSKRNMAINEHAVELQKAVNEIADLPVQVTTHARVVEDMTNDGASQDWIDEVTDMLARLKREREATGIYRSVGGFHCNGKVYIFAEGNEDVNAATITYYHERQHNINKHNPGALKAVSALFKGNRKALFKTLESIIGDAWAYRDKSASVLADEIVAYTMEKAHTNSNYIEELKALGLSDELINIISTEYGRQQGTSQVRDRESERDSLSDDSGQANYRIDAQSNGRESGDERVGGLRQGDAAAETESGEVNIGRESGQIQGLENYSRDELKGFAEDYVNGILKEQDIDASILGVEIHGSRNRGDAGADSDLDIVLAYDGDIREDDMFNLLNDEESPLVIDGVRVDINPIRKEESGSLEDYMQRSAAYDEQKRALSPTGKTAEEVVNYSIVRKDEVDAASYDYWQSHKDAVSEENYSRGQQAMDEMAAQMRPYYGALAKGNRILPLEQYGGKDAKSTIFNNASYGRTIENTLKCMRTLAYNEFTDAVKEKLGRPLTQRESFLASQMVYDIATDPQCLYCYVSLDRKAYDGFLLKYVEQRDAILEKYRALPNKYKSIGGKAPHIALASLYKEFLSGRQDTSHTKARFDSWIRNEMDGTPVITTADLTTKAVRNAILNGLDAKVAAQMADAQRYAQNASRAKKDVDYISYIGELLKMSPNVVHHLLEEYGLRFYSFSEFTPAFILENMQMVRDAALRGLNGLAYTKEIDFVKIFAPTGMNINISCYGRRDADGNFVMDSRQGADWEEAKKLREQYPNVAISFTVTNDEDVNWALEQDFVDVIIPFHIVMTGEDIANFYGWTNYSAKQADQINGTQKKKYISPVDHHNNKEHFLALCKEENITPRFVQFVEHPNYMRLVNETRRSIDETVPLQPVFDTVSAQDCWNRFVEKGGYYNGWWQCTPEEYIAAVDRVVEDVKAGKEANQVDYGRQDIPINPERAAAAHRRARQHGNRPLYSGFKAEQQNESAEESNAEIRFREVSERKQWIGDYVNAVHLVTGKDKKAIRAELNERVAEAKEEARELYGNVLSGNFNSVTLQQIDNYIDNATNGNRFYRPLSQRLRERALLSLQGRGRTGEVDALFSRICESAVPANERTRAEGRRKIEARKEELLEGWAKATGNWHESIADFTSNTEPIGHGTDSEVYLSDDGESVIKASKGKFDNNKFPTDIDQVALFNSVFPRSAYTILGYGRVNGKFVKYLEQQLVDFNTSTPLSVEERVAYMRQLGYEPQNEDQTVFSNGDIVVSDLQKSNIVRDAAGNVRVIDADVKLHTKDIGGNYTYAPVEYDTDIDGNPQPLEANTESDEPGMEEASVEFRTVQDPALLDRLNNEETISVYQSAVKIGDNYYPPMATLTEEDENGRPKLGQPVQFGTWLESEEHPERIAKSGRYKGRYPLREKGKTTWVSYNPYLHTTASPLNDQFTAAHKKPLVVLEVRVPKSELAGTYHAEGAQDSTGEKPWHKGPVSAALAKLGKDRKVILTRWAQPVREVPAEEIADKVADMLDGTRIAIPINVVTPDLRDALAERGVKFGPVRGTVGEEEKSELQAELKRIKTLQKEARKKAAETGSEAQDVNLLAEANADQKKAGGSYVSPADLEQVRFMTVYHGSGAQFDRFDSSYMGTGEGNQAFGWGHYVTEVEGIGKTYVNNVVFRNYFDGSIFAYGVSNIRSKMRDGASFEAARDSLVKSIESNYEADDRMPKNTRESLDRLNALTEETLPKGNLYTVEIPEDTGENYFDWFARADSMIDRIGISDEEYEENDLATGEDVYHYLESREGGAKQASEFLASLGYVGIKYPANTRGGGREDGAKNYVIFNDEDLQITDNIRFRLSNNNRATIGKWLDKWSEARVDALMKRYGNGTTRESWVKTMEDSKVEILDYLDNIQDATTQLAWAKWFCAGAVQIGAEDMPKVRQAIKMAKAHKVDPLQFDSPMAIINQWPGEIKEDPINPDEVNTLHKAKVLPEGLVIYDVDESEESRKNMRNIINTHFGKDCSPWCLLQGTKEGKLTAQSKKYWNHYNVYPKQVVFKNGKLLAFSANDTSDRVWWDKQDKSHDGIPVIGKIKGDKLGRAGNIEYDPETGEQGEITDIHKGNKQNGHYQEWRNLEAEHPWVDADYKDGKLEGKYITRYSSGAVQMEQSMADGVANGECTTYRDDGTVWTHHVAKNGRIVGESVAYHQDGSVESSTEYDENGQPTGNYRHYHPNGNIFTEGIRKENTRSFHEYAMNGTEIHREVERRSGENGIWQLMSEKRWDEDGKIELEWDRITSPLNTAYRSQDIMIRTDYGPKGMYERSIYCGEACRFGTMVYAEIANTDGVITFKHFKANNAGINGHHIDYAEYYDGEGNLTSAVKDVPYENEERLTKYEKIEYRPGEQDFSVDELYTDFYESKIHPDVEGSPRFSVRSFEAYKGEEALDVLNSIFEDKSEKDSLPPVSISTLDEFRRVFANPVNTIFNETIKVKDDVFNKIIKNSRSNILEAILPTLEDADFGIKDIDESILYVKRYANGHEKPGVYNIAVVNKHGELEDYISSVHIKTDNNLKNKIGKGAELLIPNNRDTYGNNAQSNSTPSDANVANNSENATQSSENETTFRTDEEREQIFAEVNEGQKMADGNYVSPSELDEIRLRTVYHGSGASFDRFDSSHMGEGEGAQAYGWGHYVTEVEGIGRAYAENLGSSVQYKGVRLPSTSRDVEISAASSILALQNRGNSFEEARAKFIESCDRLIAKTTNGSLKERLTAKREAAQGMKEEDFEKLETGHNLYTVEIPEDNGSNYFDYTAGVDTKENNKALLEKVKPIVEEDGIDTKSGMWTQLENMVEKNDVSPAYIIRQLAQIYGMEKGYSDSEAQKKQSEILSKLGYVGIKYPAEYQSGGREDGAKNYVILNDDDLQITDRVSFRISNNNRKTINSWLDKWEIARYGSKEEAAEHREFVDAWIERIDNPTTQLVWTKWFCAGKIRLGQEDMPKVEQAVELAKKVKVDPLQFDSPMAIIDQFKDRIKEKPINPDTVPTLHKAKELPDGLVTYDVDDTQESRENMRRIINTHFGKDCSPWCLLQGDGEGNLTRESAGYWDYYNAYPKQVVFKNGKLLAFSANRSRERVWWDRMDESHKGIPITEKVPNDALERTGTIDINPSTGRKSGNYYNLHKGNKQNGKYEEWGQFSAFETYQVSNHKNGVDDGLAADYYQAPDGRWIIRNATFFRDGEPLFLKRYDRGKLKEAWLYDGTQVEYYESGSHKQTKIYDDELNLVEEGERWGTIINYRSNEGSIIKLSFGNAAVKTLKLTAALRSNERVLAVWNEDGSHRYGSDITHWKDGDLPTDMLKEICEIHNVPGEPTIENLIKFCSEKVDALLEEGSALKEKYKDLMPETTIRFRTVEITPKVREEMEVIEAKARVNGTYLQAPNGAATKLSAENWAFVRTDEFKNWFGDWELALKINNLVNIIKADKEHGFKNFAEAKEWAGKNIARLYTNNETGGKGDINISKKILDKFLSESSVRKSVDKDTHLAVLKVLPDIIREGIDAEQHPDIKKDENGERKLGNEINENVTIHRVYGAVEIGGTLHRVKITLKEDRTQGPTKRVYNYEATKIELLDGQSATPVGVPRNSNNSISVANLLNGVEKSYEKGKKLLDVSKIVDENGEPRVVYHQTNSTIWVNRKTGQNFDDLDWEDKNYWQDEASQEEWEENWEEQDFYTFDNKQHGRTSSEMPAFFFSPKFDENHEYGERTIAAFLNIKNPAVNPEIENAGKYNDAGEKAMQKLIEQGYDGFIREYDGETDEINAFYPNQIKSATDYNGEVSSSENDIRLRMSAGSPIFGENGIEDGERENNRTGVLGDAGRQDGRYVRSRKPSRTAQKTPKNYEEDREAEAERGEERSGEKRTEANARVNDGIVLFRLIGEQAIKNIPEEESLRAQTNLEIAKQMKADGKSAQTILDATGWQFGKDDKPRFEEPDFKKSQVGTLVNYDGVTGMPLEDLIDDHRLFTEYPELKEWKIGWQEIKGSSTSGWTNHERKMIVIVPSGNLTKDKEFREADNPHAFGGRGWYRTYNFTLEGRKTLVHEIQHVIQRIEGFAPGTSPKTLAKMLRDKFDDISSDSTEIAKMQMELFETPEGKSFLDAYNHNLDKETIKTLEAALVATSQYKKSEALISDFVEKYHFGPAVWIKGESKAKNRPAGMDIIDFMASWLYHTESGEVEAAAVEKRMALSKAERKLTLTELSERVPREYQWSLPAKQKDTADKAMQGLQFFDKEAMTDMLMKTFSDVPSEIRAQITDKAPENGYNFGKASVDYFSGLAEREDELTAEEKEAVTTLRDNLKEALGIDILSLDDTLWSMFQTQTAGERDILTAARRAIVADRLGHTPAQEAKRKQAEDEIRYSIRRDMQSASEAEMYNRANSYAWNRLKESWVDMHESVNNLVEAVEIGTGRKAESFEDIRLALNQQSSKGLNAMQKYTSDYLEPMWEAIDSVMKTTGMTYEDVVRYVMLKHAVERNDVFARRDAKAFYKAAFDNAVNPLRQERKQLEKDRKKALADGDTQLATDCETRMQEIDLQIADEQKRLDRHYTMVDNGTAAKYRELRENDYGGLTSMFSDYPGLQPRNMYRTEEEYNAAARAVRQPRYQSVAEMEAAALAEVDAFERRASGREFDNLWSRINAATKATLESQYRSNVISREQYEAARDQFQYYVPLRGFKDTTAEDLWTYYNTELSGSFAPALLGAKGRKSEAGNPFNWIGTMASSAIAQNIKNESKLALYYFIANRPNQDLVTIQDVWYQFDQVETDRYRQAHPGSTRKIFTAVYPPFTESLSSDAAKQVYDSWTQGMEQMAQSGLAYKRTNRLNVSEDVAFIDAKQEPQHVIRAKVRGKEVCLIINGSPRAAQAINGLLNVEADNDILQKVAGGFLRFLSAVNTSFNPEFWMSNMQRDLLFATMGSDIKGDGAGNFGSHLVTPAKLIKMAKAYKNNTLGNSQIENYYREFAEGGAITGYTVVNGNAYWEKKISEYIDKPVWRKAIEGIRLDKFLQYWQNLGEAVEQMARFAAYVTAREGGKDIAASVNAAKEISVNFNRKGSGKMITAEELKTLTTRSGRHLNGAEKAGVFLLSFIPWYGRKFIMFFNASVQALNAMYKLWKANPKKLLGKWATGYFAAGVMQAVIHALFDDDDDYLDIPDYTRRTNLLLGFGGVYFKWALPQEARVFYMLGDMMVNHIMGREPHKNLLGEAASAALELLPISVTDGLAGVAPSAARPFVELGQNKDFTGARIYNEMRYASDTEKKFTPRYKNALPNTGKMFINISQLLNTVSGGDKWDAGLLNIPPESIQHIVEGVGGGLLTTLNKVWETAGGAIDAAAGTKITGEELSVRRTPFLNRLLMVNDERTRNSHVTELFYYYKGEAERTKTKARQMKKEGDLEALDALQNSKDYEIYQIYKSYEKLMKKYNERIREETDPDEKKSLMRLQDEYRKEMINEISWLY